MVNTGFFPLFHSFELGCILDVKLFSICDFSYKRKKALNPRMNVIYSDQITTEVGHTYLDTLLLQCGVILD